VNSFVADSASINLNNGIAWLKLPADQLVRFKNRENSFDPRKRLQCLICQKAFIANGPDNGSLFSLRKVRAQTKAFDSLNHSSNLVLADSRF
jgi:hypothetical protein